MRVGCRRARWLQRLTDWQPNAAPVRPLTPAPSALFIVHCPLHRLAFQLGTTAVGIQTSEGVVLAAEKRIGSKLLVPSSVKKLVQLDGRANTCEQRR